MSKGVRVGIESDGPRMLLALKGENGARATLNLTRRGACPLAASIAMVASGDDQGLTDAEFVLDRATLEIGDPKP